MIKRMKKRKVMMMGIVLEWAITGASKGVLFTKAHAVILRQQVGSFISTTYYNEAEHWYSFTTEGHYLHEQILLDTIRQFAVTWKIPLQCSYGSYEDNDDIFFRANSDGSVVYATMKEVS